VGSAGRPLNLSHADRRYDCAKLSAQELQPCRLENGDRGHSADSQRRTLRQDWIQQQLEARLAADSAVERGIGAERTNDAGLVQHRGPNAAYFQRKTRPVSAPNN